MTETIHVGPLRLRFLRDRHQTGGSLDMFEMTCPPDARMPEAHHHRDWDETVYGLVGTITFTVDDRLVDVGPGDTLFIPRGAVHRFDNRSGAEVTCLCVLTPGVLGPEYFRELGAYLAEGQPDRARVRDILLRHGLVPSSG